MQIDKDIEDADATSSYAWDSETHFHEQIDKKISHFPWQGVQIFVSDDVAFKVGDMAQQDKRFQAHEAAADGYICHYRKMPIFGNAPGRHVPPGQWLICWFHNKEL